MTLEESVFQKVKINPDKLSAFGFRLSGDKWVYETDFCDGDFHAVLSVDSAMHLVGTVIEKETEEEYLPLRIRDVTGDFVHYVREEYISLMKAAAFVISMILYVLYYRIEPVKAFYAAMVPLITEGISMALITGMLLMKRA